jgi:hypothetical protein
MERNERASKKRKRKDKEKIKRKSGFFFSSYFFLPPPSFNFKIVDKHEKQVILKSKMYSWKNNLFILFVWALWWKGDGFLLLIPTISSYNLFFVKIFIC